jgi:hypothetical protein
VKTAMKFIQTTVRIAAFTLASLAVHAAHGETFSVVSLASSGAGTLKGCLDLANASPGPHIIEFHPSLAGTVRPTSPLLTTQSVTIIGPPSRTVSIDGGSVSAVLRLNQNTNIELGLIDLELFNGSVAVDMPLGGRLNIHRCVFRDFGVGSPPDAGVFNPTFNSFAPVVGSVRSSSFINNRGARAGVVIATADAAGSSLEFINCTFAGNTSTLGAAVAHVWNFGSAGQGTVNFLHCTIAGNSSGTLSSPIGAINATGTALACRVKNCALDQNTIGVGSDPNFTGGSGTRVLEGVNVLSNAGLAPLAFVQGQYVRTPLPGSPCVNAAVLDTNATADQLGVLRPFLVPGAVPQPGSNGSDVGAVERGSGRCDGADFNGDGTVSTPDLVTFLGRFGLVCP